MVGQIQIDPNDPGRAGMNNLLRTTVYSLLTLLVAGQAMAQELYIYPAKGQSAEQQDKDKFECYNWAKNDTGFDPMAVPTTSSAPPSGQKKSGGAVRGALGGAALGVVLGDSGKSAKRGALAGNYNRAYSACLEGRGYTVK
jgi:hypothetical protein